MSRLRCPKCTQVFERPSTGNPVCPSCGYGTGAVVTRIQRAPTPSTATTPTNSTPTETTNPTPTNSPRHRNRRPIALVLLFGILTFGIYWIYWSYAVFKEVDTSTNQPHSGGLWIATLLVYFFTIGIFGWILQLIYLSVEMRNLQHARIRRGLTAGPGLGGVIGLYIVGLIVVGLLYAAVAGAAILTGGDPSSGDLVVLGLSTFAVLFLSAMLPFMLIQSSVNKFWDADGMGGQGRPAPTQNPAPQSW